MKTTKRFLIFLLFALTWAALFWVTGSGTPWQVFSETEKENGVTVELGDLAGQPYDRMGFGGGLVRHIRQDGSWIVGTDRGELFHISREGRELWKHSLGVGVVQSLTVSPKGDIVYVGEKSPDGWLYAVDAATGDIRWKFAGKEFLGVDLSLRSEPSPVHTSVDGNGNVYVNFYRFSTASDGSRTYIGRVAAFSADGKELWRWPRDGNMDGWPTWNSAGAGRVAVGTSNYDNVKRLTYNKNIYILDAALGEELSFVAIPADASFTGVTMRNGPNFSSDGKLFAAMVSDGRGFLWDADGQLLWQRRISGVAEAGGVTINAAGRDAYILPGGVLFGTINTFNRENWQMPSPVLHPSSNRLFLFSKDGEFLWSYQSSGEIEEVSCTDDRAAIAVGRNVRTHDYKVHGAAAVSLTDGKKLFRVHTAGPVQSAAISADGKQVAGIEVPAVTPEGNLIGMYRLHIWEIP